MNRVPGYLLLLCFLHAASACRCQCPSDKYQWDFSASYGIWAPAQPYSPANQAGNPTTTGLPQPTFFTVRYFLYNRLALGVAAGVAAEKGTLSDAANPPIVSGSWSLSTTTVALELYYIYYFRKYLEVYTFAGAGPAFLTSSQVAPNPTYGPVTTTSRQDMLRGQYTPAGIRAGGKLGIYAELGYGYKGILHAGISFKLGPSCWWRDNFRL